MPNDERVRRHDLALRERAAVRAAHQLVAVALDPAVDRVGAARRERAADDDRERSDQPDGHAALGEEHRRHRGDEQQLDDARLGQPDVRADRRDAGRTAASTESAGCTMELAAAVMTTTILPFMPAAACPLIVHLKS